MCSLAHQLLMTCGPMPIFDYAMIGLGFAAAVFFMTRPRF